MKKAVSTQKAPAAIGPYSQAIASGGFLFISGQLALNPTSGKLVEGNIGEQTEQIMNNIAAIVKEAGTTLSNIVKTTIFLTDLKDFVEVNAAYAAFFEASPPARSTVQVAGLPLNANVEIESIVALNP